MRSGIGSLLYVVIGVVLASSHHYLNHADELKPIPLSTARRRPMAALAL